MNTALPAGSLLTVSAVLCVVLEATNSRIEQVDPELRSSHVIAGSMEDGALKTLINSETRVEFVDRIRAIFNSRELTLAQVSHRSAQRFGRESDYFVPHNFYSSLLQPGFAPRLEQLCALSDITGFCLRDWLLVFGFDLEHILKLRMILPTERTLVLETLPLENPSSWITSLIPSSAPRSSNVMPLGELAKAVRQRRSAARNPTARDILIVKIGQQDAFAYPEICPGSLVFAKPVQPNWHSDLQVGKTSNFLYLIEYAGRRLCCRLYRSGRDRVVLVSKELAYPHLEIPIRGELQVLATLTDELRFLSHIEPPEVPKEFPTEPISEATPGTHGFGDRLRSARMRLALSLRKVSLASRQISDWLGDRNYFLTPSSISQYESKDTIPRRIHKLFTLSVLYGISFSMFLPTVGFDGGLDRGDAIPDGLLMRRPLARPRSPVIPEAKWSTPGWIDPVLLHSVVPTLLDLPWSLPRGMWKPALQDLFWVSRAADHVSPHLQNAEIAVLNRFRKKPLFCRSKSPWQQPLFVILHRDGTYECACCSRTNGKLVTRPCFAGIQPPRVFKSGVDAEVIGRIHLVIRRLA